MSSLNGNAGAARSSGAAIAVICLGVCCLVVNDALAKWLTASYSPLQIVFMRHLLATPMTAALLLVIGGRAALRTRHLGVHALRGLFMVAGAVGYFAGLQFLPIAEATALVYAAPIFITALSVPLLGERVGWRRWAAVLAGFVGMLIIVRPGAATFQPASLYVIGATLAYALMMITARRIDGRENVWTMMFYVVLFPLLYSALIVPAVWQTPQLGHLPLVLGMAVLGTLGITLISQAFRMAPAAVVAPFDYSSLIWASLLGWLVWGEVPGGWLYAGAAVIVASGIYIVLRETKIAGGSE